MKHTEKEELKSVSKKYRTFGGVHYFFANLFYCIPGLGWFFGLFAAFNKKNVTRRSIARGMFFGLIIFIILCGLLFLASYLANSSDITATLEFWVGFAEPFKAIGDKFVALYNDFMANVIGK